MCVLGDSAPHDTFNNVYRVYISDRYNVGTAQPERSDSQVKTNRKWVTIELEIETDFCNPEEHWSTGGNMSKCKAYQQDKRKNSESGHKDGRVNEKRHTASLRSQMLDILF